MPQLRVARADSPTDPAERSHVVFSAAEIAGGKLDDWFIGRDRACRMCIADASVSRRHLQVVYQGGAFHLRNVGQYGSEIDGRQIASSDPPVTVRSSLSVTVGKIGLRCTLLADNEEPAPSPVIDAVLARASGSDWLSAPAEALWSDPVGGAHQVASAEGIPSPADWGIDRGAVASGFGAQSGSASSPFAAEFERGDAQVAAAESLDWTAGLAPDHPTPAPVSRAQPAPQPVVAKPQPPPVGENLTDATAIVETILRSAGLRADIAALHARECAPEKIGVLLSQLLAGLIATLATRRSVKNTLRVAHTEVRVEGNNALKHAVTPAEALIALVQADRPGYLDAEQAIRSVFKDLADHELAIVDGVEGALKHVVELMNPAIIEQASAEPESKSMLAGRHAREARLWGQYRARFNELMGGGRAFSNQFLPAFRDAYDACLAKLRRRNV